MTSAGTIEISHIYKDHALNFESNPTRTWKNPHYTELIPNALASLSTYGDTTYWWIMEKVSSDHLPCICTTSQTMVWYIWGLQIKDIQE